jgi:tRNA 5-methylaminomethyl-2-thiouridine biosynthesis bifunctional protein
MKYDTIVVGAGIAGVATAFFLRQMGQKVLLVDKKGLLAGASGAAGAFLSPRLGKGGDLQRITNDAYRFALRFYAQNTPHAFFQKGLVRIPKNEEDAEKFAAYEPYIDVPYERVEASRFAHIDPEALRWGAFWFPHAAFVDPLGAAKSLLENVETRWGVEVRPRFASGVWHVDKFSAPNLVLATGAAQPPVALPWLSVGGVWGERVDVQSEADIPVTLHQKLSVSANIEGIVRIGATHVRNDPRSEIERVNQLIVDAVGLVPALADQRIVKIYAGHRASVPDHLPVVGPVPDIAKLAEKWPRPPKRLKPGDEAIEKISGLFIVNGFGGRGFVFGPLMGKEAAEAVARKAAVPPVVSPDRFVLRYLRRR